MNIGEVAKATDLNTKTIRYYEKIGLIEPMRQENGYRIFTQNNIDALNFVKMARGFGFSIEECKQLLALNNDPNRSSKDVHDLALTQIKKLEKIILESTKLKKHLEKLAGQCANNEDASCAILDGFNIQK